MALDGAWDQSLVSMGEPIQQHADPPHKKKFVRLPRYGGDVRKNGTGGGSSRGEATCGRRPICYSRAMRNLFVIAVMGLAGCSAQADAVTELPPVVPVHPEPIIDHSHPEIARCVAEAYRKSGETERTDGIVSVDRTGLAPRYSSSPELPGLTACIEGLQAEFPGSVTFRVGPDGETLRVGQVPKFEEGEEFVPTKYFGGNFAACVSKQPDLRTPQSGGMLARIHLDDQGITRKIEVVAVTIQFDADALRCVREEMLEAERAEPVNGAVVVNYRGHMSVRPRPE